MLTLLSFTIANPGLGDHEVVALQHYLSIIYNDRSPLQRAALSQTIQLLQQRNIQIPDAIMQNYFKLIISTDQKQYTNVCSKMKEKPRLEGIAWLCS